MPERKVKVCSQCKIEKPLDCFYASNDVGGLRGDCKDCYLLSTKQYQQKNKITRRETSRKYKIKNADRISARHKRNYKKKKLKTQFILGEISQEEYDVLLLSILTEEQNYRNVLAQERQERKKKSSKSIKKKRYTYPNNANKRKKRAEYNKLRKAEDQVFKLQLAVSNSIRNALKKRNVSKADKSISKHLPYSIQELKQHLENQFEDWMNWGNWGRYDKETWDDNNQATWTWNIDHIIPHSQFPYLNMECEEFRNCWALENLRPLSAKQNVQEHTRGYQIKIKNK